MEFSSTNTTRRISTRKNTYKKSVLNCQINLNSIPIYSEAELKMIALLSLIRIFEENREVIFRNYQTQVQQKLNQKGTHFNRSSSTITIQPVKKQIINMRIVSKQLQKIKKGIKAYFLGYFKRQNQRKTLNQSQFNSIQSSLEASINLFQSSKLSKDSLHNSSEFGRRKTIVIAEKQNIQPKQVYQLTHKRNFSDLMFYSKNQSPIKQISKKKRRQMLFMSKKKQEINFLKKITVQFASQQAEFKALSEMLQLFLKNLTQALYFVKIIDQNEKKCEKIMVYIRELDKVLQSILAVLRTVSTLHRSLEMKGKMTKISSQYRVIPIQIQNFYDKSNDLTKMIRQFLLSPAFAITMKPQKSVCSKLIALLSQSRYTLRYLQKQIGNFQIVKKQYGSMSNWQKAYRVKFIGKNYLC